MGMPAELLHVFLALCAASAVAGAISARTPDRPREPAEGQRGKDAAWVPTPSVLVEAMLDLARVTADDYVVDLGCGDGRTVIAAAKRGARALGVEFDAALVALSRRTAASEGVAAGVTFVEGDLYEADIAEATVVMLFLLPDVLRELAPKLLALKPGTRIVTNRFEIEGWEPAEMRRVGGDTPSCCTALLYVVPERGGAA